MRRYVKELILVILLWVAASIQTAAGQTLTENEAVAKVRALPETQLAARASDLRMDDCELLIQRGRLPLDVNLPAWRVDVHSVIQDTDTAHFTLWNRFLVGLDGQITVWDRQHRRYLNLEQWRLKR